MMPKLTEPAAQILSLLPKGRSLLLLFVLVGSIIGFGYLIFWNSQPDYQVLFTNLSMEDAGEMVNRLKEKKVPFQLSHNGTTLLVPKDQVYDIRLSLAAEGLPKGGGIGFEVFDRTNLGTTDFVQKLNYQRALQGELSRTIRQIKEIEQARVHLVAPKESLFFEDQRKPTASIFVKTRSGMALSPSQVEGIVHLVASAIEGLEPGNVTVVDTSGKILSKRSDHSQIGQLTTGQLEYQRNIEEGLKKKVQGMLEEVLGFNKASARVSAEIDFQQVESTEERFDPNAVLRSEQKNMERSNASTGTSAGTATSEETRGPKTKASHGAETPPKTAAGPTSTLNTNNSERQQETRNYEISKISRLVKNPVGKVRKVSVAVVVDGIHKEGTETKGDKGGKHYASRSPEEMKNIENIVKRAIGYDEERGDRVEVINMPFYWSSQEEEAKPVKTNPWEEYLKMAFKPAISIILALLCIFFVIRPMLKRRPLAQEGELPLLQPVSNSMIPSEVRAEAKPSPHVSSRDQTLQMIQTDPSKAIGIVKSWLHERE